MFLQFFLKRC
ncbi:hypothetical protein LINGRAHAP2_LOCUS8423 [Linum grandiflorum]